MFSLLGKFLARAWPVFLAGWAIVLALALMYAPAWREVARDEEFGFLPEDMPSRRGEMLYKKAFPRDAVGSNIVLVLHREKEKLNKTDWTFIDQVLKPKLKYIADEESDQGPEQSASQHNSAQSQPIIRAIRTAKDQGTSALQ